MKKGLTHGMNKMPKSFNQEVRPLASLIIPYIRWQSWSKNCRSGPILHFYNFFGCWSGGALPPGGVLFSRPLLLLGLRTAEAGKQPPTTGEGQGQWEAH